LDGMIGLALVNRTRKARWSLTTKMGNRKIVFGELFEGEVKEKGFVGSREKT
jgi:hypothetical protein